MLFLMLGCLSPVVWAADDAATLGLWIHEDPSAIAWQPHAAAVPTVEPAAVAPDPRKAGDASLLEKVIPFGLRG